MQAQDEESVVKARYEVWNNNQTMLEENFKQCLLSVPTDRLVDQIFESLKENIENPIFWANFFLLKKTSDFKL